MKAEYREEAAVCRDLIEGFGCLKEAVENAKETGMSERFLALLGIINQGLIRDLNILEAHHEHVDWRKKIVRKPKAKNE